MMKHTRQSGFTLVELLVVIAIIGVLVGLLLPAVQSAREAARRMQCGNNLKQLGLAMHNYESSYKTFPASPAYGVTQDIGGPYNQSWLAWSGLAMLLPYVEQGPLYDQINFSFSWDNNNGGTVNDTGVARTRIPGYVCPSDPGSSANYTAKMAPTSYNFSAGPTSVWSAGAVRKGIATFGVPTSMAAITDGTSNSLAMAEAKIGMNGGMWRPNVKPRDESYRVVVGTRLERSANAAGRVWNNTPAHMALINAYYDTCLAMYDSGSGWNSSSDEQGRHWAAGRVFWGPYITTLVRPNAGPSCDVDNSVTDIDVKEPSSLHPGGVQVVLCDGSVRFISETIDQATWIALGSISAGDQVNLP